MVRSSINKPTKPLFGVGLRPTHYPHLLKHKPENTGWFEVISENYMDTLGRPLVMLEKIRQDFPVATHGVSLSIGCPSGINIEYLKKLKIFIDRIAPHIVSDHFCWTGTGGYNFHDLLPIPFTQENQNEIVARIDQVQTLLGRKIILENVSSYITYKHSEMTEWEFIRSVCERSGCGLLFDVNNLYVNATNYDFNPQTYIDHLPKNIISQIHLAGFSDQGTFLFDTHSKPVFSEVWKLYEKVVRHAPDVPVIVEWDENLPPYLELEAEAKKASAIWSKIHEA